MMLVRFHVELLLYQTTPKCWSPSKLEITLLNTPASKDIT